jgi:hypothetical protein
VHDRVLDGGLAPSCWAAVGGSGGIQCPQADGDCGGMIRYLTTALEPEILRIKAPIRACGGVGIHATHQGSKKFNPDQLETGIYLEARTFHVFSELMVLDHR